MKRRIIIFLFLLWGLYIITEYKVPENKILFSGNSVVRSNENVIDNLINVIDYAYVTEESDEKNVCLKDTSFYFEDGITLYGDMCPQGICFMEDYLLISSYSMQSNVLSIVSIYEKETKEYKLSLALDSKSHLGGIACDGENIWICNSSKMTIERISCDFVLDLIEIYPGQIVDVRNMINEYTVNVRPSSICIFDDSLWVVEHSKLTDSRMISYTYEPIKDELILEKNYRIPSKVQGIAFDKEGRVLLSTSYGRKNSSYLKIYDSVDNMSRNVKKYTKCIEMPPCSEGIVMQDDKLFVIFESASKKYLEGTDGKGKSIAPLDRILVIDPS